VTDRIRSLIGRNVNMDSKNSQSIRNGSTGSQSVALLELRPDVRVVRFRESLHGLVRVGGVRAGIYGGLHRNFLQNQTSVNDSAGPLLCLREHR
jgi:hypothetical protein